MKVTLFVTYTLPLHHTFPPCLLLPTEVFRGNTLTRLTVTDASDCGGDRDCFELGVVPVMSELIEISKVLLNNIYVFSPYRSMENANTV